jgi:hypothetical protein
MSGVELTINIFCNQPLKSKVTTPWKHMGKQRYSPSHS